MNSVTGEEERLESVLPLVARHGAAVVAITNDENGISEDSDERFEIARKIVERAAEHGIPKEDIVIDPLVMPIGAIGSAGRQVFSLVRRLREELGVNTTCGASNISFGLPNRHGLNAAFLPMAIASGLTSAITSPLHEEVRKRDQGGRRDDGARRALRNLDRRPGRDAVGGAAWSPRRARGPKESTRLSDAEHLVVFTPSGRRGRFERGTTVLEAARRLGVDLDSVCGGRGICGRCQVGVDEGEHAKHGITSSASHLSAVNEVEQAYAADRGLADERRLGCVAHVEGDLVIDVPPESQVYKQVVRKEADAHPIEIDPGCAPLLRRGRGAASREPVVRRAPAARGARARMAARRTRARPDRARRPAVLAPREASGG